jgi:hypothetical protein
MGRSGASRGRRRAFVPLLALVATLLLTVSAAAAAGVKPLKIKPETLKLATATVPYSQALKASGGTAPYTFSLQSGAPPEGVTLSPGGELLGTANAAGSSTFTVLVSDSSEPALSASATYTLPVQLDVGPKALGSTRAFDFFIRKLTAVGGTGPYDFTLLSGEIPEGVLLYSEPGFDELNGSPFNTGSYSFTLKATDQGSSATGTRTYKLKVGLTLTPEPAEGMPEGIVGHSYLEYVGAVGGSGNYTVEVTEGALPEGTSFTPEGVGVNITGTPTKAETATFKLLLTDTVSGLSRSGTFHIVVRGTDFPSGVFILEDKDHGGELLSRDEVGMQIEHEAHGRVTGTLYDFNGSSGHFIYTIATRRLRFNLPETTEGESPLYAGFCEPAGEACSGEDPSGTFTLSRPPAGA